MSGSSEKNGTEWDAATPLFMVESFKDAIGRSLVTGAASDI